MLHPTQGEIFQKESWIGGPTYIFQKQHIPGYQGHVPSLNAESLFSKNFARLTSNCLENRVEKGFIINEHQRFQTTNKAEFGLPDLRKAPLTVTAEQILEDYHKKNHLIELIKENEEKKQPKTIEDIPPIDRLPVIGYMGYKPIFRHPLKQVKHLDKREDKMKDTKFINLDEGYQKMLLEDELMRLKLKDKDCPIVGYTGFISGIKAENKYGRSYKDISKECIIEKTNFK